MCLLNSEDRDVATAQTTVLGTLRAGTRAEMAAAQTDLIAAVAAKTERQRQLEAAKTLARPGRRGRKRVVHVIDSMGLEVAA